MGCPVTVIKGLTLTHPWPATFPVKDVENRTWRCPTWLVGEYVALHAGTDPKGAKRREAQDDLEFIVLEILEPLIREAMTSGAASLGYPRRVDLAAITELHRAFTADDGTPTSLERLIAPSQIFAVARIEACIPPGGPAQSPWHFADSQHGWMLTDVVRLAEPVSCAGHQGLWDLEPDVLARVRAGYARSRLKPQATSSNNPHAVRETRTGLMITAILDREGLPDLGPVQYTTGAVPENTVLDVRALRRMALEQLTPQLLELQFDRPDAVVYPTGQIALRAIPEPVQEVVAKVKNLVGELRLPEADEKRVLS